MRASSLLPLLPFLLNYPTAASPLPRTCTGAPRHIDTAADQRPLSAPPNVTSSSTTHPQAGSLNLDLDINLGYAGLDVLNPDYDVASYPNRTDTPPPFQLLSIRARPLRRHLALSQEILQVARLGDMQADGLERRQEEEGGEGPMPDESAPEDPAPNPTPTPTPDTPPSPEPSAANPDPDPMSMSTETPSEMTMTMSTATPDTPTASTEAPSTPTADTPTASTEPPSTPTADAPTASTEAPSTPTAPSAPDQPYPERQRQRIPVFSESAVELIQAELEYVRNKYANAMKMLTGAPTTLASVDVVGGGGAEGVGGEIGEGGEVGARISLVPDIILDPTPTASETETVLPKMTAPALAPAAEVEAGTSTGVLDSAGSVPSAETPESPGAIGGAVGGVAKAVETGLAQVEAAAAASGPAQKVWSARNRSRRNGKSRRRIKAQSQRRRQNIKRKTNSPAVPLIDYIQGSMDVLYYGEIGVGTPEQTLTVDFDTGSADLWIPAQCQKCKAAQFNSPRSSTYRDAGKPFSVEYGSGSVSGRLAQDVVTLGNTVVKNQYFGAVTEESEDFKDSPHSGIMGMAFSSIASSGQKTYFENLMDQGSVKVPIFSFHLARRQEHGSQLCIGCYDSTKFTGAVTWLPLVSKTYWSISMTGFSARGPSMNALTQTLIGAIDTGTTLIYVPPRVATQFYSQIPGSEPASQYGEGFFQYPCKADASIQLRLGLNNKGFDWNVADFNLGRTAKGSSMCVGAILGVNDGFPDDLAIIGDVFLKSWYSVYDQSSRARVGFAASTNNKS